MSNADTAQSAIRVGTTSPAISGLITPAASIAPGADDPSSGFASFSALAPNVGGSVQGSVSYANAVDFVSNLCTFTITVSRPAQNTYNLHFSVGPIGTPCSVPGDAQSSGGQFTGTVYALTWTT